MTAQTAKRAGATPIEGQWMLSATLGLRDNTPDALAIVWSITLHRWVHKGQMKGARSRHQPHGPVVSRNGWGGCALRATARAAVHASK